MRTKNFYDNAINLLTPTYDFWKPKIFFSSRDDIDNLLIEKIWENMNSYKNLMIENGKFDLRRKKQRENWLHKQIFEELFVIFFFLIYFFLFFIFIFYFYFF
jgi:LAO/AO transport system kinase